MKKSNTDPQRVKYTIRGLIIFIFFVSTVILIKVNQDRIPWKFYHITIQVEDTKRIERGSPIICNQVEIGLIDDIDFHKGFAILHVDIKRKYNIPKKDIILSIETDSKKNEDFIKMEIGKIQKPYLEDGDIIKM